MRAYRPCAWWIEPTVREEHSESLTSLQSPFMTLVDKIRRERKNKEERNNSFLVFFLLAVIVFEHIWAHLFPHRKSPVQLTWTISRETKASVEGGGFLLYGQVERQQPHFLLISSHLSSLTCMHLVLCYFHTWIQARPARYTQPPALLNTPFLSLPCCLLSN